MGPQSRQQMVVDWEGNPAPEAPTSPETAKEAGLSPSFLSDQLMRTMYVRGPQLGRDMAQFLCLPFKVTLSVSRDVPSRSSKLPARVP